MLSSKRPVISAMLVVRARAAAISSARVRGDTVEFEFRGRSVTIRTSTGTIIDAEARRRYEERIRELQADVDEAERDNDYARANRHQTELDELIDHLTAALGHGGRNRRAADNAERARST